MKLIKQKKEKKQKKIYYDALQDNYDKHIKKCESAYKIKTMCIRYIPILILFMVFGINIISIVLAVLLWILLTIFFDHRIISVFSPVIRVWFGVPGAGKTSVAAWLTRSSLNKGVRVLSNVEISDAYKLDADDLGNVDMSFGGQGCHVVYDEAGIDFDNRNYNNFARSAKPKYFAMHRHQSNMVDVFSQGYDIDKRIRDRTSKSGLFYLARFPVKGFVYYRKIKKIFLINKEDKQMIDGFDFYGLPRILYVRSIWDSFDTLDKSVLGDLKVKEWQKWGVQDN